jgi:hypothetical protein
MDNIRSEATALEFDVHTDEGFLDITKRGDPSLFYRSLYPYDDPRVLSYAYQWLLQYRHLLEQTDQARRELTGRPRSKTKTIATLIRMTLLTGVVCWLYIWLARNNWGSRANIWWFAASLSILAWTGFCLLQIHTYRKSKKSHKENTWGGKP